MNADGDSRVVKLKTRRERNLELLTSAAEARDAQIRAGLDPYDRDFYDGPAGDWTPIQGQVNAALGYAESHYDSGTDEDFEVGHLIEMLDGKADPMLDRLNDAQVGEIVAYGEARSWVDLTVADFRAWRTWAAAPPPIR